jgi:hypothetical protein
VLFQNKSLQSSEFAQCEQAAVVHVLEVVVEAQRFQGGFQGNFCSVLQFAV